MRSLVLAMAILAALSAVSQCQEQARLEAVWADTCRANPVRR